MFTFAKLVYQPFKIDQEINLFEGTCICTIFNFCREDVQEDTKFWGTYDIWILAKETNIMILINLKVQILERTTTLKSVWEACKKRIVSFEKRTVPYKNRIVSW